MATQRSKQLMRQVQKRVAIGMSRAYRTVAYEATLILSGISPFKLLAQMYAEVYRRTRALRDGGSIITNRIKITLRYQARRALVAK